MPRMRATVGLCLALFIGACVAGCSDSSASPLPPVPSTVNAQFMTGNWIGALGTNEAYQWSFSADGAVAMTDPTATRPGASGRWSLDGSTLVLTMTTPRGKTNTNRFETTVRDADNIEVASKDFGAVFKLRRLFAATQPAAGAAAVPKFDAAYLVGGWRGPVGTTNQERSMADWDFAADGTLALGGADPSTAVTWRIDGSTLTLTSTAPKGKPHVDAFPARVIDAHHLELSAVDWGGKLILSRKPPGAAATRPRSPAAR